MVKNILIAFNHFMKKKSLPVRGGGRPAKWGEWDVVCIYYLSILCAIYMFTVLK